MSQHPIPVLLYEIIQDIRARNPGKPVLVGVAGAQGSGKSYACRLLAMANQPRFAHFSLDDVYLTRAQRENLASGLGPLFGTRGPPGSHDPLLLYTTLGALLGANESAQTPLPRFDKSRDDRAPIEDWPVFSGRPEAILVDGWLLGASAISLDSPPPPLNELESEPGAMHWLEAMATFLSRGDYCLAAPFDAVIYLQAPSWEIVRTWRAQQEEQLLGRPLNAEENAWLDRFLMHYERITRSMMAGNHSAKWIVHLDEARNVVRIEER